MSAISLARENNIYSGVVQRDIAVVRRDMSQLREQLSTGKRINRPSDDPDSFSVAKRMQTLTNRFSRHEKSIEAAQPWVDRTQQKIDQMVELFARAREEGVRAANESLSASDRKAIAEELKSIREQVIGNMNARHNDEYLFAGNQTTQKPFDNTGQPTNTYADISGARTRTIGPDQMLAVNITGKELHQMGGGNTITGALDDLITAVENDNTTAIETALGKTKTAHEHVVDKGAEAGTIARRLSTAKEQLQSARLNAETRQSNAEDTNYARALADMQKKQTQLQAALKAASTMQQTSLVDFLR